MQFLKTYFLLHIMMLFYNVANAAPITIYCKHKEDAIAKYTISLLESRLAELAGEDYDTLLTVILDSDAALESLLGREGYHIEISDKQVLVSSATSQGLLFGSCGFIEWVMGQTTEGLVDPQQVDIDFPVKKGQAAELLSKLPYKRITDKPFYGWRGNQLTIMALGVADLIDTDKGVEKYNTYSGVYFQIPDYRGRFNNVTLTYKVNDIDGDKAGEEAVLRMFDSNYPIEPTGDGQSREYILQVPMDKLTPGQHKIEFVLAGKPLGTAGYFLENCTLTLSK